MLHTILSALAPTHTYTPHPQPNNQLERLPAGLFQLTALRQLNLKGNRLTAAGVGVSGANAGAWERLARLETLDLSGNASLGALPPALGRLQALRSLSCAGCGLQALPGELGGCGALEALDVSGNPKLAALPAALGRLRRLKTLNADGAAALAAVPPELLRGCTSLQTLSLHGCPITAEALQATDGFQEFEARRRGKFSKIIAGGAALSAGGLDEGVDRPLAVTQSPPPPPPSSRPGSAGGGGGSSRPGSAGGGGGGSAAGSAQPSRRGSTA